MKNLFCIQTRFFFPTDSMETVKGSQEESEHNHICIQGQSTILYFLWWCCVAGNITSLGFVLPKTKAGLPLGWKAQTQEQHCAVPPCALSDRTWRLTNVLWHLAAVLQAFSILSLCFFSGFLLTSCILKKGLHLFRCKGFFTWKCQPKKTHLKKPVKLLWACTLMFLFGGGASEDLCEQVCFLTHRKIL